MRSEASSLEERGIEPLARALFRLLRDRSDEDKELVRGALRRRLQVEPDSPRERRALTRLREVQAEVKRLPSEPDYRAVRDRQEDRTEWPSEQSIRNMFGGWAGALALLGGPPVPDILSHRLRVSGPNVHTPESVLIAALQMWASGHTTTLRQGDFVSWCSGRELQGFRLPTSKATIWHTFGGWEEALLAAGLLGRYYGGGAAALDPDERALAQRLVARAAELPASGTAVEVATIESLAATLLASIDDFDLAGLTRARYDRVMKGVRAIAAESGVLLRPTFSKGIVATLGSWKSFCDMLRVASSSAARSLAPRSEYRDEEISAAWTDARAHWHGPPTRVQFRRWRDAELRDRGERARIPTAAVLQARHGGPSEQWDVAASALEDIA